MIHHNVSDIEDWKFVTVEVQGPFLGKSLLLTVSYIIKLGIFPQIYLMTTNHFKRTKKPVLIICFYVILDMNLIDVRLR